jgi:hypothetical protein
VEKIIERKKDNSGRWLYYVKWTGYPENENSWELGVNISYNALKEFWIREGLILRR